MRLATPLRALPLLLLACGTEDDKTADTAPAACDPVAAQADAPAITPGAPQAGVSEHILALPVGLPLSGYTGRCDCFGGDGEVDHRDSAYTYSFNPSAGVQSPIMVKAFWMTNGDQDLVILKIDLIYSFDGLVAEMEERLSAATGRDLRGKVVVATNHSHNAYGDFSDQVTYYLGSDRFNYEIFIRMAEQAETTAMEAYDTLQPVKIGVGFAKDWDPADRVYHDRRGDNDNLGFFPDIPSGPYKDPNLTMIRIDTMDDAPLGVLFNFGIHGTTLDADNAMISPDAPGQVERGFEETFDTPVVVALLQGGAGDASPSGSDDGYARLETIGEEAGPAIHALWASTPTGADPIRLETVSRSVPETHDEIHVRRNGTTDMHYVPYTEDLEPDNIVYDEHGAIIPEIDEFNAEYGGAFCGEDVAYLEGYAPADVPPYDKCVDVSMMVGLIKGFFDLTDEEAGLPLVESTRAGVTAARFGPVAIRDADGTTTSDDFFIGFFPGEPTALYTEQFRRRAAAELGYDHSMAVGYAQDHEGYLLLPEDWLMGGYEADINIWGPLQAEHIMEGLLTMAGEDLATDIVEHHDPCGDWARPGYGVNTLPTLPPEVSPDAGTLLTTPPDYVYSPLYAAEEVDAGVPVELTSDGTTLPRVQGILQMAWIGGDPGVDWPMVTLERLGGTGSWETVLTPSGRPITSGPDILVTTTPSPEAPATATQTHTWYAAWQALDHTNDRAGLPTGTYRLHVLGREYTGSNTTWPWDSSEYEVIGPTVEVVEGALSVDVINGNQLRASIPGPARGYRLVAMNGSYRGANPLPDDHAFVTLTYADMTEATVEVTGVESGGTTVFDAASVDLTGVTHVHVEDAYGNQGDVDL